MNDLLQSINKISESDKSCETSESNDSCETSDSSDQDIDYSDNLNLENNIIRNYNIIYEIGKGAYSIVWLAYSIITNNFYALKVQDPNNFKDGMEEVLFVNKLPKKLNVYNHIIEYFIEIKENKKYLCSVWDLHSFNLDTFIRKSEYNLTLDDIKHIMKQLITGVHYLHTKMKIFHGDIKSDNILIKGINEQDNYYITEYSKLINNNINNKDKKIRFNEHNKILNLIKSNYNNNINLQTKYITDQKYLNRINISLADFGTFCEESNYYNNSFGTRYYQAPEIILMGKCSYAVDIWALGCTFYELLSSKLLFDPIKDAKFDRNYYHLCLINETCGVFPSSFLHSTTRYKKYFNSNNKLIEYDVSSENRLINKLNELNLINEDYDNIHRILKSMLTIIPNKRITATELIKETWFN
jgi:serine/threonine-protein kinase SRPK3